MLPQLVDGERATLTDPRVDAKKTQPSPRYNEGTLVDAMQNAWRFVTDDGLDTGAEKPGIVTPR
jgi:DNA topoisomerase III